MWLEEIAWLWLPVLGGVGIWGIWSMITLKTEVRALHGRLEKVEAETSLRRNEEQKVV